MKLKDQFEEGWYTKLAPFIKSDTFKQIANHLVELQSNGTVLAPMFDATFRAFKECPFDKTKVVILGLDPYPTYGDADGLAFSCRNAVFSDPPASLQYMWAAIEKEVYDGLYMPHNPEFYNADLSRWANQGVLLLNQALSTVVGKTGVHLELWQPFIREVFRVLRENHTGLIYIFLGSMAKRWIPAVNKDVNHILTAQHPAVAYHNKSEVWDSEGVFKKTNEILTACNGEEYKILW